MKIFGCWGGRLPIVAAKGTTTTTATATLTVAIAATTPATTTAASATLVEATTATATSAAFAISVATATPAAAATATTFATSASAEATATGLTGFRGIHAKGTATEIVSVHRFCCVFHLRFVGECHEAEAPGTTRLAIGDQFHTLHWSEVSEELGHLFFGGTEGQIAHVDVH